MKDGSSGKAYLLALLAVLFWSTSPTAFKLGLRYCDPYQLLTGASFTSVTVLGLICILRGGNRMFRTISWRDLRFSALLGLLNPVAYYLILFRAYSILPAQVAQPLNMVWPIVLVIISIPMLRQKIRWTSIGAMFLSFSGVIVLSLQGGTGSGNPDNGFGIFLALSTSVIWAFYWIFNARETGDPVIRLFFNFLFASIYLLVGGFLRKEGFPETAEGWFASLYVGVFEMGVTFVVWLLAMQKAPTTDRISNLVFMAPFLNLVFVRLVLHEKIFLTTILGIVLLVAGIVIQNITGRYAQKWR